MIGTAEITKEQAQVVIENFITNKGVLATEVPEVNGCIKLQCGVTLRKLPVAFRNKDPRSKAFRIKGAYEAINPVVKIVNEKSKKSIVLSLKND